MGRYVISRRRDGASAGIAKLSGAAQQQLLLEAQFVSGRRSVTRDLSEQAAAQLSKRLDPLAIIEPEILHTIESSWANSPTPGSSMLVEVLGDRPLEGATVLLTSIGADGQHRATRAVTNDRGEAEFSIDDGETVLQIEVWAHGYWNQMVATSPSQNNQIVLTRLPPASAHRGWWHDDLGIKSFRVNRGTGVRIGVIDTGCGPNDLLNHVQSAGSFLDNEVDSLFTGDVYGHGTMVCGILGARPTGHEQYGGIAPGAEIVSACVFGSGDGREGANQGDIADAIDAMVEDHRVDLINMSLGAELRSQVLVNAIEFAASNGVLCVCAAGNEAGRVRWPAQHDSAIAVTAYGRDTWPPATAQTLRVAPRQKCKSVDSRFFPYFCCTGKSVNCTGPGVGIISTVPDVYGQGAPIMAMNGTSFASPAVCGALAASLAESQAYQSMARDVARADFARRTLLGLCKPIGFGSELEGAGCPMLP